MKFKHPQGATPIDDNELSGLIPDISLQSELNVWEQTNITDAVLFYGTKDYTYEDILNVSFLLELHKRMFNKVWKWAGKTRWSGKNIGVDVSQIYPNTKDLCENVKYWIQNEAFPVEEISVRFHHRLVHIHIFPNGNGRHSRYATDLLAKSLKLDLFTWGHDDLSKESEIRNTYISALHEADEGNYQPLLNFVRT